MFLQNILQQRLQSLNEEEAYLQQSTSHDAVSMVAPGPLPQQNYLKAQIKVGSTHNRQQNYARDQTVFTRWDDDTDPSHSKVKNTVENVKHEIDRDFLGTKKPAWNESVGVVGHPAEDQTSKQLFEIKKGLKDEKIQSITEQRVYAGTDTRDAYHTGWNGSTEMVHARDAQRFLNATREPMLAKTKQTNAKMLMRKTQTKGVGYTKPEQLTKDIQTQVREKKEMDREWHAGLKAEVRNQFPGGTEDFINATVNRQIYEANLAAHIGDDPELTLRPNLKKTIRYQTVTQRLHNGKYELDRFSTKEGKKAWSCCMNKREDSEGCVVRKVDKQKWNVEGF